MRVTRDLLTWQYNSYTYTSWVAAISPTFLTCSYRLFNHLPQYILFFSMKFSADQNLKANHSTFNDIGRDQNIYTVNLEATPILGRQNWSIAFIR